MAGIGVPELAIVLVIIVIIFGVGKLPEIGGALGKGIREFKTETTSSDDESKEKIDAGTSATASNLTSTTNPVKDEPAKVGGSRADEI